jgi:hypothetical protein
MTLEPEARAVRQALRLELESRGYRIAGDTVTLRGELYVRGDGDHAAALFEFKSSAEEAVRTMYQGSWTADLPPRFAVIPVSQRDKVEVDLLRQAGMEALFYKASEKATAFVGLDTAVRILEERRAAGTSRSTGEERRTG